MKIVRLPKLDLEASLMIVAASMFCMTIAVKEVSAASMDVEVSGEVTSISGPNIDGVITAGDAFQLRVTYDDAEPDASPLPNFFAAANGILDGEVRVGPLFSATGIGSRGSTLVVGDNSDRADFFHLTAFGARSSTPVNGPTFVDLALTLVDRSQKAFDGPWPLGLEALVGFDLRNFPSRDFFVSAVGGTFISGEVKSASIVPTSVPEPSSILFFGTRKSNRQVLFRRPFPSLPRSYSLVRGLLD